MCCVGGVAEKKPVKYRKGRSGVMIQSAEFFHKTDDGVKLPFKADALLTVATREQSVRGCVKNCVSE